MNDSCAARAAGSDAREQVRARAGVGVVGGALVRVLAVGEVAHLRRRASALRERLAVREPVRRSPTRRPRSSRTPPPRAGGASRARARRARGAPRARPRTASGRAHRRHVGEVLAPLRAQHRRAADVDHLDGLLLAYAVTPGDVLERVEVHADEVERRMSCSSSAVTSSSLSRARQDRRVDRAGAAS